MKKLVLAAVLIFAGVSSASAQAFSAKSMYLSVGLGGANYYYFGSSGTTTYVNGYAVTNGSYPAFTTTTGELTIQAEWAVHKYVGIGGFLAVGGGVYGYGSSPIWGNYSSNGVFNVPAAVVGNFHFYQLIADKVGKNIHADKLDVYAGINVGSGLGMVFYPNYTYDPNSGNWVRSSSDVHATALLIVGANVGARYFFTEKVGVNLELGYGKTFVNAGITFKVK
ncbi:MAG: hypothetical protein JST67_07260 [Bacteroidetes bacterium]|nr:hypothetical protein [Bacteroidota bacterium]